MVSAWMILIKKPCLGILSFETARTMSRVVSLYKSLSGEEISRLRNDVITSEGVVYLNSRDKGFLLSLAAAEMLEDLDHAATAVGRLQKNGDDLGLKRLDLVHRKLKTGMVDLKKLEYGSRGNQKKLQKMEKLIAATSCLQAAMDALAELEVSEKKIKQLNNRHVQLLQVNLDLFTEKLENQRKKVRHFREISLWVKAFDKIVRLMTRIVCVIYVRIYSVFGAYIARLPFLSFQNIGHFDIQMPLIEPAKEQFTSHSGPIKKTSKPILVQFYSQKSLLSVNEKDDFASEYKVLQSGNMMLRAAGPSTLGGSGLALRYANVILLAEKYLDQSESLDDSDRESLYQMLPEKLKVLVRTKLSKKMKRTGKSDVLLAKGWRDAMEEMLRWLAPLAHDTVKWQAERNFEKMKMDNSGPCVLLLQTLHFSDKEKTETAIAELLVGLSCIYRHENRQACMREPVTCCTDFL